jgi:GGDEF domain-containing protein
MPRRRVTQTNRLKRCIGALRRDLAAAEQKIAERSMSPWFGCLNRNGLDAALVSADLTGMAVVYWDLDSLKACNDLWGKSTSSQKVASALSEMRKDDVIVGQWFSGDEFLALVPFSDAMGFAQRMLHALQHQEMSATFVITPLFTGIDLFQIGEDSDEMVNKAKKNGNRGSIVLNPNTYHTGVG